MKNLFTLLFICVSIASYGQIDTTDNHVQVDTTNTHVQGGDSSDEILNPDELQNSIKVPHFTDYNDKEEVTIENAVLSTLGKNTVLTFNLDVKEEGKYSLFAWIFSPVTETGKFMSFDVFLDNKYAGELTVTKENWHFEILNLKEIVGLTLGKHSISFTGKAPFTPQIEFIKFQKAMFSNIPSSMNFDTYYHKVLQLTKDYKVDDAFDIDSIDGNKNEILQTPNTYNPPYDYTCQENIPVKYTYYTILSFNSGDTVKLSTTGINSFGHILEFFSRDVPQDYSWVTTSDSSCTTSLNITIPQTGWYVVRIRSNRNAQSGVCNLKINNYIYNAVPLYSYGIRCTQDTSMVYNTFTTHCGGGATLWIEEGAAIPGRITSYNRAYVGSGDFNWTYNSRIKKQYTRPVHAAQVNTLFSYIPESTCDLYIKCKEGDNDVLTNFPNLSPDDAINSASATNTYNCIAWAGGIYNSWVWPSSQFCDYFTNPPIAGFDEFFGDSTRYPGCAVYTREGATENNSVVDLWGFYDSTIVVPYYLRHASVRKGGDLNHHGYDWESKPGGLARTFHPRYSLEGDAYGKVQFYYRCLIEERRSFQDALAADLAVIENIELTPAEQNLISSKINEISSDTVLQLNTLYKTWEAECANSIHSNPYLLKNETYSKLVSLLKEQKNSFYYIADKLSNGNELCFLMLEDLSLNDNDKNIKILEQIRESNKKNKYDKNGKRIVHSIYSNAMNYVKILLSEELANDDNLNRNNAFEMFYNVNQIIIDNNIIWAATDNGLVKTDKSTGESHLYASDTAQAGINDIRGIAIDDEGCIYAASKIGSIYKLDCKENKTTKILDTNEEIAALSVDKSGNLWFSTQHYLNKYDGEKVEKYQSGKPMSSFNIVYDMAFDENGVIWLAGVDNVGGGWALSYFDGEKVNAIAGAKEGYYCTYGVTIDKEGNKWFAENLGLVKYDGTLTRYTKASTNMTDPLVDVDIDNKNVVWYASADGGIGCFDGEKFESYFLPDTTLRIRCIAADDNNIVYVGTTNGIYKYEKGKSALNLSVINGVTGNAILLTTEYYTMDGKKIRQLPNSGIVIKREYFNDGSVKVQKCVIK